MQTQEQYWPLNRSLGIYVEPFIPRAWRLYVPFKPGNPSLHFFNHPELNLELPKTPRYDLRTVN